MGIRAGTLGTLICPRAALPCGGALVLSARQHVMVISWALGEALRQRKKIEPQQTSRRVDEGRTHEVGTNDTKGTKDA